MRRPSYLFATRHPWPCLLFLAPFLLLYEAGVLILGGPKPELLRNGADTWLRWGLESFGLPQLYCAPVLIVIVFLIWSLLRFGDRPQGFLWLAVGMTIESVLFAVGLWMLSRELGPFLEQFGIHLSLGPPQKSAGRVITFVGAGIYEEVLFRLLLFFALGILFRLVGMPGLVAALVISMASSLVFAAAHHLGPHGEPFDGYVFVFRALAGLYFALLYQLRGFGVVVGTHACYDVLVGMPVV
jgi:membrane protease YdiL (CAAX protease family)